jgi:phytoene dehydrogenase-like protein
VFDSGVQDISGLNVFGSVHKLLAAVRAEDRIRWKRVLHGYYHKGTFIHGHEDIRQFIDNLCTAFPWEQTGLIAFFEEIETLYAEFYTGQDSGPQLSHFPQQTQEGLEWITARPRLKRWLGRQYGEMLDAYFHDDDLKTVLTTLTDYITDAPRQAEVLDMIPLFGYYLYGGYYPCGGAKTLPDLLTDVILKTGGTILTRCSVDRFLTDQGRIVGVSTRYGRTFGAAQVISNVGPHKTFSRLSGQVGLPAAYSRRLKQLQVGPSSLLLNIALDYCPDLPPRTFVLEGEHILGIGNPSAIDPSLAPPGCSALTALHLLSEEESRQWIDMEKMDCRTQKDIAANRILDSLEASVLPDMRRHILYKQLATPRTFCRYTDAFNGNIYGAALKSWRPYPQTPIRGLFLVGAGTFFGAGIEAVILSSLQAVDLISA